MKPNEYEIILIIDRVGIKVANDQITKSSAAIILTHVCTMISTHVGTT